MNQGLSCLTLPPSIAKNFSIRYHKDEIYKLQQRINTNLLNHLQDYSLIEIINVSNNRYLPLSDLLHQTDLYYTDTDYIEHIDYLIYLLNTYPNYQLIILNEELPKSLVCVKEGQAAIIAKTTAPSAVFTIYKESMVSAFWQYLETLNVTYSREKTIKKLLEHKKIG